MRFLPCWKKFSIQHGVFQTMFCCYHLGESLRRTSRLTTNHPALRNLGKKFHFQTQIVEKSRNTLGASAYPRRFCDAAAHLLWEWGLEGGGGEQGSQNHLEEVDASELNLFPDNTPSELHGPSGPAVLQRFQCLSECVVRSRNGKRRPGAPLWAVQLSEALTWNTWTQYKFKDVQHINLQESKARKSLVKRLPRDRRVVICQDSRVNLGALAKGRSPSRMLNGLLRTESPYILGKNLRISGAHFPTWSLRADAPSRQRPVEPARAALPPWFWFLKSGNVQRALPVLDCAEGLPRACNRWWVLLAICCCNLPTATAPRPPQACPPDRTLLEKGRITTHTFNLRQTLLNRLETWLKPQLPMCSLETLARFHMSILSEWLEEYVVSMYVDGQSRRSAAETLNALAQRCGWLRGSLSGPWDVIRTWDTLEPVKHHPPMPAHVQALVSCALAWNWSRTAVVMCGLLRPSESISLRRQDLSLPEDRPSSGRCPVHPYRTSQDTESGGSPPTCAHRRTGSGQLGSNYPDRDKYVLTYLERLAEVFST